MTLKSKTLGIFKVLIKDMVVKTDILDSLCEQQQLYNLEVAILQVERQCYVENVVF